MINRLICFLILVVASGSAMADPMFVCGNHTIEAGVGTPQYEVRKLCGDPTDEDGNRWIYANQYGGKTVIVHFDGGTVSRIEEVIDQ